jgi:hypothetical protein
MTALNGDAAPPALAQAASVRGNTARKLVPRCAHELTSIRPPCARVISLTMNSPRPTLRPELVACVPRVIGSKSPSMAVAGMGFPWLCTSIANQLVATSETTRTGAFASP